MVTSSDSPLLQNDIWKGRKHHKSRIRPHPTDLDKMAMFPANFKLWLFSALFPREVESKIRDKTAEEIPGEHLAQVQQRRRRRHLDLCERELRSERNIKGANEPRIFSPSSFSVFTVIATHIGEIGWVIIYVQCSCHKHVYTVGRHIIR